MNEQKQKIISDICLFYKEYGTCEQCNKSLVIDDEPCYWECMADAIINNNYVKQSEGEWVKYGTIFKCTACNRTRAKKSDFCPNCGAKMKGGVE